MVGVLFVYGSLDLLFLLRILQSALQTNAYPSHAAFQQRSHGSKNFRTIRMLNPRIVETNDIGLGDNLIDDRTDLLLAVSLRRGGLVRRNWVCRSCRWSCELG
jgi:hypothetical protein